MPSRPHQFLIEWRLPGHQALQLRALLDEASEAVRVGVHLLREEGSLIWRNFLVIVAFALFLDAQFSGVRVLSNLHVVVFLRF